MTGVLTHRGVRPLVIITGHPVILQGDHIHQAGRLSDLIPLVVGIIPGTIRLLRETVHHGLLLSTEAHRRKEAIHRPGPVHPVLRGAVERPLLRQEEVRPVKMDWVKNGSYGMTC